MKGHAKVHPSHVCATDVVDLSPAAIAELEALPDFAGMVLQAAALAVETYRGRWMLNRLMNDRGRFIASLMILDLHFASEGGGGFTSAQLRREAMERGLCSPGRITAFVAALRLSGLLTTVETHNRRARRLAPTDALLVLHRQRWGKVFTMLATVRPEARGAAEALRDPAFIGHCAHVMMDAYRRGERLFDFVPALKFIADRDAGLTMLMSLLIAPPGQGVSVTALAQRFSISRSHVLETLRIAERTGLASPMGPRGGYVAGGKLAPALGRFFSVLFLIYLHAFVQARALGWDIGAPK